MSSPPSELPETHRPMEHSFLDIVHPRGRIWPPLDKSHPRSYRLARALIRLGQGLYYHDIFRAAPAMAFNFFLSLLPLLVFVGYVLGLVAERKGVSVVLGMFIENLPRSTEKILKDEVRQLAAADRLGPLAAIGFFWIASGGIHGLMDSVEMVVGAQPRPYWKKRLYALVWVVVTLLAFGIASYGAIEWEVVTRAPDRPVAAAVAPSAAVAPPGVVGPGAEPSVAAADPTPTVSRRIRFLRSSGEKVLTIGFSLAVAIGGLSAFYRFAVAHSRRVRRRVVPGAVLAVVLWVVASWGFGLYVQSLTNYTVYYGSLAAVAVLLVWLWLMSLAMLVGAELNAQLEGLRDALSSDP